MAAKNAGINPWDTRSVDRARAAVAETATTKPVSVFGGLGESHTVDMTDTLPLCGKNVPFGSGEMAPAYGYRCVLESDHSGDCQCDLSSDPSKAGS